MESMHPFSIDYITRGDDKKEESDGSEGSPSRKLSPGSSPVPSECQSTMNDSPESIAQALLSLDRSINCNLSESGEKPQHSYIALISMAILSTPDKKMLLSDIYQYIMDNFSYYNNKDKAWRNSIRHNLSLNECFVKNGRSDNGKGNYWSIHPACLEDFSKGDFRRRHARRRARKSMKDVDYAAETTLNSRYNIGYIPMTTSPIGFHPYGHSMYFQHPTVTCQTTSMTSSVNSITSATSTFYNGHSSQSFQQASVPSWEYHQSWQPQLSGHFDILK